RERNGAGSSHASERLPEPATSATTASTAASAATARAIQETIEEPPPASESLDSSVGAGLSELSGPVQSTTEPSEYVCLTPNVKVLLESARPWNENAASSPVGTLPPSLFNLVMTALSPDPVCWTLCF